MARRGARLSDRQWEKIGPLLPKPKRSRKGGRPWRSNREVLDGIFWVLKTGGRWEDLPEGYPSPSTCWRRLRLWEDDETWVRIWRTYLSDLDERSRLHWEETFLDGTFTPAKKGGPVSAQPSGARARSAWFWQSARVYLWEFSSPRPRRRK